MLVKSTPVVHTECNLEQIFAFVTAASKNEARFLSGQNRLKIIGSLTTI
jgi:hypothetical protein